MKVLQVNKFLYLHGGVSRYCFNLANLLENSGHKVAYFAMDDEKNIKTKWSKYFVANLSFREKNLLNFPRLAKRMFYSQETARKMFKLISCFKPDIAHVHNIYHHLSPSLLYVLKDKNIPTVMTVHDYHLISPNYRLFHSGKICEITKRSSYYKAIFHKCVKNSYLASAACAFEMYLNKIFNLYNKCIDTFVVPSQFMKSKLIEYGMEEKKIVHLPHFVKIKHKKTGKKGRYILFLGRLVEEKGLSTLIDAMLELPYIDLIIAGRGEYEKEVKEKVAKDRLKNINFVGHKEGEELAELLYNCRFVILPSIWYENQPNAILEAFACKKPVVASRIGGIPEIVKDNYNGLLFEPGSASVLKERISKLWSLPAFIDRFGKNARTYAQKYYSEKKHYIGLTAIYKKAIDKHREAI